MKVVYWLMGLDAPSSVAGIDSPAWYAASPLPAWAVVLIALIGLAAAGVNLMPRNLMPARTRLGLLTLRLIGFGILLTLVAQIEVRVQVRRDVRPRVAVLTDVSGSMGMGDAGGRTRIEAARTFADRLKPLADRADVTAVDFSWRLNPAAGAAAASTTRPASAPTSQPSAEDPGVTRIVDAVRDVVARERDLQAVVLLTDGNDTAGDRGTLLAAELAARRLPVFPVVFGEAGEPKVASVKLAAGAPYVRLGDEFRLGATLVATNLGDQSVGVRVYEVGQAAPIASRENVRLGNEPVVVTFSIKPAAVGRRTYRVAVDGVKGSVTQRTLVAEQTVDVIDQRVKVLYLDIPRDERKILGHWLARDPVVDLASLTMMPRGGWYAQGTMLHANAGDGLPDREEDLYKYDVIILGDVPRAYFRAGGDLAETKMQRLVDFVTRRGGGLITLGGRSVYAAGQYADSALARLLPFDISAAKETQVNKPFKIAPTPAGLAHPLMLLQADPAANREAWLDLPALDGNNFVGPVKAGASLLAQRNLDGGGGAVPVIAIQPVGKGQVLSLSADTTWRWEMMRPEEGEDYFVRFWGNAIRTLAPDPRLVPDRPQVTRYETSTPVGQTVTLSTRLVDKVYKPVRDADLVVKVTSPSGKVTKIYPRDGREAPGLYEYQVTLDEPGSWEAVAAYRDQVTTERIFAGGGGDELDDPRAKPEAMATFAKATGGAAFSPGQADELLRQLTLSPRTSVEQTTVAVWNLPAVTAIFMAIVCVDCLVRKRRGMV